MTEATGFTDFLNRCDARPPCVMLALFQGQNSVALLRYDLPQTAQSTALRMIASSMLEVAVSRDADRVIPVVHTEATLAGRWMPQLAFVDQLVSRARSIGIAVSDALCVTPDAWGSYFDVGLPRGGHVLDALDPIARHHPFARHHPIARHHPSAEPHPIPSGAAQI